MRPLLLLLFLFLSSPLAAKKPLREWREGVIVAAGRNKVPDEVPVGNATLPFDWNEDHFTIDTPDRVLVIGERLGLRGRGVKLDLGQHVRYVVDGQHVIVELPNGKEHRFDVRMQRLK
jgi:hypothetical protein